MKLGKMLVAASAIFSIILVGGVAVAADATNGPKSKSIKPMATAAGPLTIVSAQTNTATLANSVVVSIPITGTTNDTGSGGDIVCGVIWDDGTVQVTQCQTVPVGTTSTVTFTLAWTGSILTGAPGVGVNINDATSTASPTGGGVLASVDPLTPDQFTEVAAPIPTLQEWALLLMGLLLGGLVWRQSQRKGRMSA